MHELIETIFGGFQWYRAEKLYLILALFGGGSLLLFVILGHLTFWRPRTGRLNENPPEIGLSGRAVRARTTSFFPWMLTILFIYMFTLATVWTLWLAAHPPNW